MCVVHRAHVWRAEDNLLEFQHMCPKDETQVVRLGGKHL